MLRGFRHTLFLLLQVGTTLSALLAWLVWPEHWRPIAVCLAGTLLSSLICERIASRYLRRTLGRLRRVADDIGRGRQPDTLAALPGEDFHKMVNAINLVANRLAEANEEEQRLQEQLRHRERLAFLGELAATVAHEINNPLDGIQNCARILRRSGADPDRTAQMLDLIDSGLNRIDLIVRRLMTLAREHVIRPVTVDVRAVIESSLAAAQQRLESGNVAVRKQITDAPTLTQADPQLLEQVFVNIILNAVDSMPENGLLEIQVRRAAWNPPNPERDCSEEAVYVEFRDNGSGIPPDVQPHIFEPFYTTKSGGRGTGLGLAIASRIIDAHSGAIQVTSEPGGGTCFTVQIPARPEPATTPSREYLSETRE